MAVYRARAADSQTRIAAHVGWTHVDLATGRYREAIERLRSVSTEGESNSDWHAALADALAEVGEYDDALAHGRRALALAADNVHARYRLARLLERLGRRDEAVALYEWFDKLLHDHLPERADELTDAGRGFYRYSVLTRHENLKDRCRYVLQEVYQEAYEFVDSRYWPARLAAAELMLEKHNLNEATSDLRRVLQANGKATGAYVGLAAAALENWNFDEAEKQANKALEVNPRCAAALLALGRTRMLERRYEQAEKVARQMLATNPRDIEGLALLAAAQLRSDQPEAAAATAKRLEAFAPHSAALHFELGYWLSAGRQYADSERELRAAIAADPTWPEPRTELGLLLMQSGDERGARRELEAAWQLDSFNHQTFNVLGLLDELEKFATYDAGPFTLRYDPAEDSAALPFMARRLKGIYSDVTKLFGFEPTQKTTIEIFPQHSRFSVRITGRPWIHTVGACTGPIIAIDAPREGASIAPYNWASTLRHEFSH
ncbi:MAG: tetratricopeptide repeat protein, partial [Rubrivivax sp.]